MAPGMFVLRRIVGEEDGDVDCDSRFRFGVNCDEDGCEEEGIVDGEEDGTVCSMVGGT